jgi:hypothetical protein
MWSRRRLLPALALAAAMCVQTVLAHHPGDPVVRFPELALAANLAPGDPHVVVYGGTPAGVAAAIGAAKHRAKVVLLAEGTTVGGMMSNGISATDVGSKVAVTGVARLFFDRIKSYYRGADEWRFEPRIAERVLVRMLSEAGVEVRRQQPLLGVRMNARRIACVQVAGGELCAPNFIDASYTGDLLAAAGVPHRLGMSDLRSHGENLALRRTWFEELRVPQDQAAVAPGAFEANPYVRVEPELPPYSSVFSRGTPSLTYRLCVTSDPAKQIPFTPAVGSDAWLDSFRIIARTANPSVTVRSNGTIATDLYTLAKIPGNKYDVNAGYASFTNIPSPDGYFTNAGGRPAADQQLRDYIQTFFWFVQNDASVPPAVRDRFRPFGLCADEFADNGGWPYQPYVREGRRLVGRHTLTVADIYTNRLKPDTVAVGSYHVDNKTSQWVFAEGSLYRDTGVFSSAPVYEIPFAAMVPTFGSVTNLLVPVGLSSSPTAFGSVRMEPQWMALGEAAGLATSLASREALSVAALPASRVQSLLRYDGVVHTAKSVCQRTPTTARRAYGFSTTCGLVATAPDSPAAAAVASRAAVGTG